MALDARDDQVARVVPSGARRVPRARYLPIAEHGLIGDLHTVALVGTDGTIDWYCCPRFDSPSVFASILDADHGGLFRISPDGDGWSSKQLYLPDTNVLITRFLMPDGVGEVQDFMLPRARARWRTATTWSAGYLPCAGRCASSSLRGMAVAGSGLGALRGRLLVLGFRHRPGDQWRRFWLECVAGHLQHPRGGERP